MNEVPNQIRFALQPFLRSLQEGVEFGQGIAGDIGQISVFQVTSDLLRRIQLGRSGLNHHRQQVEPRFTEIPIKHRTDIKPRLNARNRLANWIRRDWLAILLFLATTLVMTYPLAFRLNGEWLAIRDEDTYMKLWDNWWVKHHLETGQSFFFTSEQFYPEGLDLTYHSISWTIAPLSSLLSQVVNDIIAYNVTILTAVFLSAYAAYLLIIHLVGNRIAAWLGGAIYSFAPYHIAHTGGHPDLIHLAPIPLATLFLLQATSNFSKRAALMAALMIGIAAFTSLYIMVFCLLTIGMVLVFQAFAKERWRDKRFWQITVMIGVLSALLLTVRLSSIFQNSTSLSNAIESKYTASMDQTDLLAYVTPSQFNPLFAPFVDNIALRFGINNRWPAYLGLIPLVLTGIALTSRKYRSNSFHWFLIGLLFFFLSLGPVLRFNGQVYEFVVLPAAFVAWFPPIRAVARPDFFVLGMFLPLAVCSAYGFVRLLEAQKHRRFLYLMLIIFLPALLLFEYWNGVYPTEYIANNPFYAQLAEEEADFAIIQLPMGRSNSKKYLYWQTVHHKSIVEGLSGRTPPGAYDYINGNSLLSRWKGRVPIDCKLMRGPIVQGAVSQLFEDGFRYMIIHHENGNVPEEFASYFLAGPVYQDADLTVYTVNDLLVNLPCQPHEPLYEAPPVDTILHARFGDLIDLYGISRLPNPATETPMPIAGSPISIDLVWQGVAEIPIDYKVFVHLVDREGRIIAQSDTEPAGWTRPTTGWASNEYIVDHHELTLAEEVKGKELSLRIGLYDASNGERLQTDSDDFVLVSLNQ